MKCSKCGAEFEGKFCSNCGTQAYYTYDTAKQNETINQQPKYADPTVKIKKPKAEKIVYEKFATEKVEKVKTEKLPRTPQQNMMIGCGALLALPIILVVIVIMFSFINPAKSESQGATKENLIYFSQDCVSPYLKSPSSAKFPYISDNTYTVKSRLHNIYIVTGYVDSQNSFGAMLRSNYVVTIEYDPNTKRFRETNIRIE